MKIRIAIPLLLMFLTACATLETTANVPAARYELFPGTKMNIAALKGNKKQLRVYTTWGAELPVMPLLDLPLSFVADSGRLAVLSLIWLAGIAPELFIATAIPATPD